MTLQIIYYIKIPNKEIFEKLIDLKRYCLYNKYNNLKKEILENNTFKKIYKQCCDGIFEKNIEKKI